MVDHTGIRTDWWTRDFGSDVDLSLPGIYEWRIGKDAIYVGKSKPLRSRDDRLQPGQGTTRRWHATTDIAKTMKISRASVYRALAA